MFYPKNLTMSNIINNFFLFVRKRSPKVFLRVHVYPPHFQIVYDENQGKNTKWN